MSPITSIEDSKPPTAESATWGEIEGIYQKWRIRIQGARNNYEWTEIPGWKLIIHAVKKEEYSNWTEVNKLNARIRGTRRIMQPKTG